MKPKPQFGRITKPAGRKDPLAGLREQMANYDREE